MQFIFHISSGAQNITLENKQFHHIFKVRRTNKNKGEIFKFANLKENIIYFYRLVDFEKKEAIFELVDSTKIPQNPPKTHIIQAIIDNADFDKALPILNELFVEKITLFYADFSQKNYRINLARLENILIYSSMQCGRLSMLKIEILKNLDEVLDRYDNAFALDFNAESKSLDSTNDIIIGPEGGFSKRERILLENRTISLNHPLILRSHTASIFVASQKLKKF